MSDAVLSDRACQQAKHDSDKALRTAGKIKDPLFQTQALAWIVRFAREDIAAITKRAEKTVGGCADAYQEATARAWVVAALAERQERGLAQKALKQATAVAASVTPLSSRAEAWILLLQAALAIDPPAAEEVNSRLQVDCGADGHWRCKRACRDGKRLLSGEMPPRLFFW